MLEGRRPVATALRVAESSRGVIEFLIDYINGVFIGNIVPANRYYRPIYINSFIAFLLAERFTIAFRPIFTHELRTHYAQ